LSELLMQNLILELLYGLNLISWYDDICIYDVQCKIKNTIH
jgi:hypothetical protein